MIAKRNKGKLDLPLDFQLEILDLPTGKKYRGYLEKSRQLKAKYPEVEASAITISLWLKQWCQYAIEPPTSYTPRDNVKGKLNYERSDKGLTRERASMTFEKTDDSFVGIADRIAALSRKRLKRTKEFKPKPKQMNSVGIFLNFDSVLTITTPTGAVVEITCQETGDILITNVTKI